MNYTIDTQGLLDKEAKIEHLNGLPQTEEEKIAWEDWSSSVDNELIYYNKLGTEAFLNKLLEAVSVEDYTHITNLLALCTFCVDANDDSQEHFTEGGYVAEGHPLLQYADFFSQFSDSAAIDEFLGQFKDPDGQQVFSLSQGWLTQEYGFKNSLALQVSLRTYAKQQAMNN